MGLTNVEQFTAVALTVFRLNGRLIEWGDRFCEPHGLTSSRWQVLGAIYLAPESPSVPQIAAAMGLTRQGVQKQINLLVEEGLVDAKANPTHKRSPLYVLSVAGRETYEALQARWQEHARTMSAQFSPDDLNAAKQVLETMLAIYNPENEG